jgi:hypothetical protein
MTDKQTREILLLARGEDSPGDAPGVTEMKLRDINGRPAQGSLKGDRS